ncbi:MAG: methionyl-tRNA formyltransferase [bacterium]
MRIALFAQAAFGEEVLRRLIQRKEDVVVVYTPLEPPGGRNPVKELAWASGIPVVQPKRMKDPEIVKQYKMFAPDLNLLAFVTDIIPAEILNYPRCGSIQYHPSLLPKHRGKSAINWAVIQGEKKTGLSIFWVDEGIDTGPILLQKEVEISEDDTTGSLYFNKLFPLGVDALMEALDLVKEGRAPRVPQDESQATYEPPCEEEHARVNWNSPLRSIYDLVRGCDPQPGAWSLLKGTKVKLYSARPMYETSGFRQGQAGEILRLDDKGVWVAAGEGVLLVGKLKPQGGNKMDALTLAKELAIGEKDRFQ